MNEPNITDVSEEITQETREELTNGKGDDEDE